MEFAPRKILEILERHNVAYVLVGGVAGTLHGSPLSTDDLDIVPDLSQGNLDSLARALNAMNARIRAADYPEGIAAEFTGKRLKKWVVEFRFLNLTTDFGRLDVMQRPGGFTGYEELATNAERLEVGSLEIAVAALEDIIRSKETVARERDLAQLPTLKKLLEKKSQ